MEIIIALDCQAEKNTLKYRAAKLQSAGEIAARRNKCLIACKRRCLSRLQVIQQFVVLFERLGVDVNFIADYRASSRQLTFTSRLPHSCYTEDLHALTLFTLVV